MGFRNAVIVAINLFLCLYTASSHATVQGHVIDSNQNPIEGAFVRFTEESRLYTSYSSYTDADGFYQIDFAVSVDEDAPQQFSLGQNYPNPFNPSTTIPFSLDTANYVSLSIYNIMGQKITTIVDHAVSAGNHTAHWNGMDDDGNHVSAGIYFYRLKAGNHTETKKMLLLDGGRLSGVSIAKPSHMTAKIAGEPIYTVNITHNDIIPYEETGVIIVDGQTMDFKVYITILINGMTFVSIPDGTFRMGSNIEDSSINPWQGEGHFENEQPMHDVSLSSFDISPYEITNAQYAEFLNVAKALNEITIDDTVVKGAAGAYSGQTYFYIDYDDVSGDIHYSNSMFTVEPGKESYPVYDVHWHGAKAFAWYYGFDLPTEAEWEYACRAGTETMFYTGNNIEGFTSTDLDVVGWYIYNREVVSDDYPPTSQVGKKQNNAFGMYDMHGNVWEWCNDWYDEDYYALSPSTNPTGPDTGSSRVVRGGGWFNDAWQCRSAYRGKYFPSEGCNYIGFRVVHRPGGVVY